MRDSVLLQNVRVCVTRLDDVATQETVSLLLHGHEKLKSHRFRTHKLVYSSCIWLPASWRWDHRAVSKCRVSITHWRRVTTKKNGDLRCTAAEASQVQVSNSSSSSPFTPCGAWGIHDELPDIVVSSYPFDLVPWSFASYSILYCPSPRSLRPTSSSISLRIPISNCP